MSPGNETPAEQRLAGIDDQLRRSFVRAVTWTGLARSGTQIASWLTTLIVATLLTPGDYGLFQMAMVFVGLVALLNEFGIGAAVVTLRDLDRRQLATLNTFSVGLGVVNVLLSAAVALPIGRFFGEDVVSLVIVVLSSTFLLAGLRSVPQALLQRDFRFGRLVLIEAIEALSQIVATLLLALHGAGIWALVLGRVIGACAGTGLVLANRCEEFGLPLFKPVRKAMSFSADIFVANLAWFAFMQAAPLLIGRALGAHALGVYGLAWTLSQVPVDKFASLVVRLIPPYLSALAHDRATLRRSFLRVTEAISAIVVPLAGGISLVAGELVPVVLGDQWLPAVAPLRVLAIHAVFQSIVSILPQVLRVTGATRFLMLRNLGMAVLLPSAFLIALPHGTTAVAWVWLTVYPVLSLPLFWRVFHRVDVSVVDYLAALWPALSSAAVMAAAVLFARTMLVAEASQLVLLGVEVVLGAVSYVLAVLLFHRARVRRMVALLLESRSWERPADETA
jgi:PST family polysaccharide transporter